MKIQTLKNTVADVMQSLKSKQAGDDAKIFSLFNKNLTRGERRHTRCASLCHNVLVVNVDSSAWLYELAQKKENLLTKLGIKDIRFRIGQIEEHKVRGKRTRIR